MYTAVDTFVISLFLDVNNSIYVYMYIPLFLASVHVDLWMADVLP